MNVLITGASGMVGAGVLLECLDDPRVSTVRVVGRSPCGVAHPKLHETLRRDLFDFAALAAGFADCTACFFCLGVSSAGMPEHEYRRLTFDLTVGIARELARVSPEMTFCYVSGQGTDSSGKGRVMWARVKGETENALFALPFRRVFAFRPGYIQPMRGVRTKTALYKAAYTVVAPLYPLLRRVAPNQMTTSVDVGRAMLAVAAGHDAPRIVTPADINRLAGTYRG